MSCDASITIMPFERYPSQLGPSLQPLPHSSRTSITDGMPGAIAAGRQTSPTLMIFLSQLSPVSLQAQTATSAAAARTRIVTSLYRGEQPRKVEEHVERDQRQCGCGGEVQRGAPLRQPARDRRRDEARDA